VLTIRAPKNRRALKLLVALGAVMLVAISPYASAASAAESPASLPALPDGRGYEKVSPANNDDGNAYAAWPLLLGNEGGYTELPYDASPSGDALAYIGQPSEEGGIGREGENQGNQYVARRGAGGRWEVSNVTPPSDEFFTVPYYQAFSPDLTQGLLTYNGRIPLVAGAPAESFYVPYKANFLTAEYESLLPAAPPHRGHYEFGAYGIADAAEKTEPVYAGSTASFSHILYIANDALAPQAVDGGEEDNNLYDFHEGELSLVNVLPNGNPEPNAVFGGPVIPPDPTAYEDPDFSHVISETGSRIFWTGRGANQNIYMREGGTRTVQVDAGAGGGGQYWTATPDGSKVLFTKEGNLYEYDIETGQTNDLVPGGEVLGIVGTSEDLSYVYFVANAALAPGAQPGNCEGGSEECNLYVLHAGEPVRLVARLSTDDNFTQPTSFGFHDGDWQGGLGGKEAEVTPGGNSLLFSSVLPLTGYANNGKEELYVYEYEAGKLRCISCNRSGVPAEGLYSAYLPVSHQATYALHWMSTDGSRVFFESDDALVSQDKNGVGDVYEWERDGTGSCAEMEGCIYLISGATAGEGAYLIDASASGNDVFFTTRAKLLLEDENENIDVYDAHVGAVAPPASPQCTGTGCQGIPSAPPVFSTPSSVTYNGVGNFPPPISKPAGVQVGKGTAKKGKGKKTGKKKKGNGKKRRVRRRARVKGKHAGAPTRGAAKSNGRSN
jgi:hypothetical protein